MGELGQVGSRDIVTQPPGEKFMEVQKLQGSNNTQRP